MKRITVDVSGGGTFPPPLCQDSMKDYRLTIKVRNNRLLKAIEAAGGTTGKKWCSANGLGYARVNCLVNMTSSPLTAEGTLHADAEKLCDVLGKLPEDLWSNEQLYPLERNFSEMEMDHAQVVALLPPEDQSYLPDFANLEHEQTRRLVTTALSTLTGREREVIQMRFTDDLSFDECGTKMGISRTRVQQIEAKALRKLKHPTRLGMVVDAVDFGSEVLRAAAKTATANYLLKGGVEEVTA